MKSTNIRRQRSSKNRERLIAAASSQFHVYGFEDTTLESIADEAGFHVQTLYRHFPKKNDLVLALLENNLAEFLEFMQDREASALSAWRRWVEINAQKTAANPRPKLALPEIADYWHRYEAALANEIAFDMGVDPRTDLRPMLAACMLVGTNKHTAHDMLASGRTKNWVADLLTVVDVAIDQLAPSLKLDGKQKRRPTGGKK